MPRCRSAASPSPSPPLKPSDLTTAALFTARAFPPPSLSGVPVEYIIDQLHNLAPHYWDKPDTADCTLVIPVPHPRGRAGSPSPLDLPAFSMSSDSGLGRRVTEPALNNVPRISLKLHMDYLSAHSSFLRGLFSGASSLDLISSAALSSPSPSSSSASSSSPFAVPPNRLPRLMPCAPDHPILFLPVPDPASLPLLVHWMYFGSTQHIAAALAGGAAEWEGLARNAEYLGLPAEIKVFLGRWYARFLHPRARARHASPAPSESDDEDAETLYEDDDAEDEDAPRLDLRAAMAAAALGGAPDDAPKRGRTRTARPLSMASAHSV
ncbi:hypothetical protein B0H15DRAFT_801806 [Mycena belliarum]|uniref:BTB domain-containing protein n=1 Tax=Mycena belliarum TaxID=1033014 RepID=A0AAD6U5J3_9AGAR|nr:hypothetical protein B0H15DRAFT_801806 [Mycena belliae]